MQKLKSRAELKAWFYAHKKTMLLNKGSKKRPGTKLAGVKKIVLHYTAVAGASPSGLGSYWQRTQDDSYASAHFGVGNNGFVIYIPVDEVAWHVGAKTYMKQGQELMALSGKASPNYNTIGIEMCQEGMAQRSIAVPKETINNAVILTVYMLHAFGLTPNDVCGHFQVTGKHCPAFALLIGEWGGQCTNEGQLQPSVEWISLMGDIAKLHRDTL